jgi:two-component system, sensor histidine kinase and response regulator
MKGFVLLLAAWAIAVTAQCQTARALDSLLKVLDTHTADSSRMLTLRRIGSYYIDNNPAKAIGYFEKVVELAQQLNDSLRLANAHYDLGFCYLLKGDFDQSLAHYQQSEKIYASLKDKRRWANALMSIGNVFFQTKNFDKANGYYNNAEAIVLQTNDQGQLSTLYSERGLVYDQLKQYDTALRYLYKALELARADGNEMMVANGLSNIGLTLKHKNNTAAALRYMDTVMQLYQKMPNAPLDNIAATYNNIGATQAQAGNPAAALTAFYKSIEYAKRAGIPAIEMENYRNMTDLFASTGDHRQQSLYLTRYHALKDSMFSTDSKNRLTQLEADYQLEKKNSSLAQQAAETNRQKNQRNLFILIAIGAMLLLGALAFFYRRIQQNNRLLQEKNRQINQQKEELQSLNQVKDRLFSVIGHDLRNPLASLNSYLSLSADPSLPPQQKEKFHRQTLLAVGQTGHLLDNLLAWANAQLKNTQPTVVPVELQDAVASALGSIAAQAAQKNITIEQHHTDKTVLAEQPILEIVLRNLVTNAVKFSHAGGRVTIGAERQGGEVHITVKDEGVGMNSGQLADLQGSDLESTVGTGGEKGSGLGLLLVKQLLQKMGSRLQVSSEPGKGSLFTVVLPGLGQ